MCSFYRQWSLPRHCNILNSGSQNSQRDRYTLYSKQLEKAHSEKKDMIILTDENLNSLEDNCQTGQFRNFEFKNIRDSNIINFNLTYHNNLPTFFRKGSRSCIDFIISNCPTKLSNIRTHYNDDNNFQYKNIYYN